jgi:hypothetical protein
MWQSKYIFKIMCFVEIAPRFYSSFHFVTNKSEILSSYVYISIRPVFNLQRVQGGAYVKRK